MLPQQTNLSVLASASNEAIRAYFLDLTLDFLSPIEAYLKTLLTTPAQLSLLKGVPKLGAFKEADFLRHYSINGGKEIEVYRRFLRTPNFVNWFRERKTLLQSELIASYVQLYDLKRLHAFISDKSEIQIVDLLLRIIEQRQFLDKRGDLTPDHISKMGEAVEMLLKRLPESMHKNIREQFNLVPKK